MDARLMTIDLRAELDPFYQRVIGSPVSQQSLTDAMPTLKPLADRIFSESLPLDSLEQGSKHDQFF
jgi:hypothetical protein